jgi:hypothetical protein
MTTKSLDIQITDTVRPNHVAATVDQDGVRLGHVIPRGTRFLASRKNGSPCDIRRMAIFYSVEKAVDWIAASAS